VEARCVASPIVTPVGGPPRHSSLGRIRHYEFPRGADPKHGLSDNVKDIEQQDHRKWDPDQPQQKSASHVDLPKTAVR